MTGFNIRLTKALELRGMKPIDLARKTGIGKSSISQYLSGDYMPKQTNIYKIADALSVDPDWLCGRVDTMESTPLQNAKNAMTKYNLYIAAINALGWEERIINQYGEPFSFELDDDEDKHNVWQSIITNGKISFPISAEDSNQFEEDLMNFVAEKIYSLMKKATDNLKPDISL